ncbi:S1C family serine protease [Solitalea koreensis]|uniref:Trypsin-like peptidase domain-containing protein n=1 Tax=Solitalea koreensis TaxID=543615 RepID=A0A521B8P1_9SPHI|nr:S1C family serine protease [Solitalea koreensis]SMO43462.1 Trypsin-like peptidase domain-containing protein [Solitalea koreensis]
MNEEQKIMNEIERYLNDEMSEVERRAFDSLRRTDSELDGKVVFQQQFISTIKAVAERKSLSNKLEAFHSELDIEAIKTEILPQTPKVIQLWRSYKNQIAIAATVAFFTIMGTLVASNLLHNEKNASYRALRRDMESIKRSQNALIRNINSNPQSNTKLPVNPGKFGGTSFVLSSSGYLITNYHVVNGADSIYLENDKGEVYKAKPVYMDQTYDLAVLQIDDPNFKSFGPLPYTFKKNKSDLGEEVFTLGFPRDEMVYGKGYLSSATGFGGDTVAYQVSIPANPGNSGGPLIDSKGNIVGVVSGKQNETEGATFAIRSQSVLKFLNSIPHDSLDNKIAFNKITFAKKNSIAGLSRTEQIKKMKDYVFMVKVYN